MFSINLNKNKHIKRLLAEEDNAKLESMLKDRNETVNKLTYINDALKDDKEKLANGKKTVKNTGGVVCLQKNATHKKVKKPCCAFCRIQ